jgi:hypothetical protein
MVDLSRIIGELKAEHENVTLAIECLERLAQGRRRGPGRPPAWLREIGRFSRNDRTNPSRDPIAVEPPTFEPVEELRLSRASAA